MSSSVTRVVALLRTVGPVPRFCLLAGTLALLWLACFAVDRVFPIVTATSGPIPLLTSMSREHAVALTVFIGPATETALFQALPLHVLKRARSVGTSRAIWASAVLFGAAHATYSLAYALGAIPLGFVLALGYAAQMRAGGLPFYLVSSLHGLYNFAWLLALGMLLQ